MIEINPWLLWLAEILAFVTGVCVGIEHQRRKHERETLERRMREYERWRNG